MRFERTPGRRDDPTRGKQDHLELPARPTRCRFEDVNILPDLQEAQHLMLGMYHRQRARDRIDELTSEMAVDDRARMSTQV